MPQCAKNRLQRLPMPQDRQVRLVGALGLACARSAGTVRAPGRRDANGGDEEYEQRRRSPMRVRRRAVTARPLACVVSAARLRRVRRRGAAQEKWTREARFETPLHGRRCLRRQGSLSVAQLVPFRARATFEAAPARNDARPRAHVARLRVLRDYSAVTGTFAARRLLLDVRPSSGGSEDSGLRYHQGLTALPEQALRQITTAAGHSSGTRQRIAGATQQSTKSRRLQEGP